MKRLSILILLALMLILTANTFANDTDCAEGKDCKEDRVGISKEEILAYPEPEVKPLPVATDLLHDRYYQQVKGKMEVYDAPHGKHIRTLDAGFNFVTTIDYTPDGWTMIGPGEWVKTEVLTPTNHIVSKFTGVMLPEEPLPYTMAWILVNMYPSTEPGGDPSESNPFIYRYTRVNLYDTVEVDGWRWYQIGVDQWVKQTQVAKVIPVERPEDVKTRLWVSVDLYEQVLIAYEGDQPIFTTLVSSGLPRWPTFEGVFNIYWRRTREDMTWGKPGDDYYYLEEVPWTMFFDEGRALHGSYWHDGLGYRRSHGCVNMSITDAHWLYQWVAADMGSLRSADREEGPAVYVYSSGQYIE